MREKKHPEHPFKNLGTRLKTMRERLRESLSEVSGAVEIDEDTLAAIETGKERPAEDILLLLINHFDVKDDEAATLWELAGYAKDEEVIDDAQNAKQIMMVMPVDVRVVYTDMAQVTANNYGIVMNFMQTSGPNGQPLAVSRVGMSVEHAHSVVELLQKTLRQHAERQQPRGLPESGLDPSSDA